MANEDKKDFNAMLNDNKDMPKFQTITDEKSIEKYGGDRMYFAPPIDYDKVMRLVPFGKLLTVGTIREYFARINGADFTEPITAGIFVSIVAWASFQRNDDKTPYLQYRLVMYDTASATRWTVFFYAYRLPLSMDFRFCLWGGLRFGHFPFLPLF